MQSQKQTVIGVLVKCVYAYTTGGLLQSYNYSFDTERHWHKMNTKAVICACKHMQLAPKPAVRDWGEWPRLARVAHSDILL